MCVCNLSYSASIAHASYFIVICAPLSFSYFSTLPDKWHEIRKNIDKHKACVLLFSTAFV
jgi:hypothetical protein